MSVRLRRVETGRLECQRGGGGGGFSNASRPFRAVKFRFQYRRKRIDLEYIVCSILCILYEMSCKQLCSSRWHSWDNVLSCFVG